MDVDHCVVVGEAEVMTVFVASSVVTMEGFGAGEPLNGLTARLRIAAARRAITNF